MFAERLVRARKAAGMSMDKLGQEVGVSANAIKKYEHDENMPSSANLIKLAKALGVRSEYFFRPTNFKLQGIEYRKRSTVPKKILNKIEGDVVEQAERWMELLDMYPDSVKPVSAFALPEKLPEKICSYEAIESVANQIRADWQLGLNAIPDMIDTLESKGVMVIVTDVEVGGKFDGLAAAINETPVIVVSSFQSGDRQRFTLAHELGHLVLDGRLSDDLDEEKACNHFAGAFLLPKQSLFQHMGKHRSEIEAQELFILKHEFGISMMAILYRLGQCGIISEYLNKRYFMSFNKMGWRTVEPNKPYPNESSHLFKQLVYRALGEDYIGESKAAELMGLSISSFHTQRKLGANNAAANQ